MRNELLVLGLLAPLLTPLASGCKCQTSLSSCDETAASDVVFIGTVESIEPKFLSRWNLASGTTLRALNDAYLQAQQQPSKAHLDLLKELYFKTFPDLPPEEKDRAEKAIDTKDVTSSFYASLDRGMRVRFNVKTLFKHDDGDDDDAKTNDKKAEPKKPDDDDDERQLDVWNSFGDCGFDFQVGETYLVYANIEEGADYIFTDSCTRTRRLSDVVDDLAYLYFYKNTREQSSHLEGFTTSDANSQSDFDPLHAPQRLKSPVTSATIELKSDTLVRYTQPDRNGRFTFDGLPEGDYRISAFADGYPKYRQLLAAPKPLLIKEKSCARQVLLIPAGRTN